MLKELFDRLVGFVETHGGPKTLSIPSERKDVVRIWNPSSGEITTIATTPSHRTHVTSSVDALARFVITHNASEIWCSHSSCMAFIDRDRRYDCASLPIGLSDQMKFFVTNPGWLCQQDILRAFKLTFHGCAGEQEDELITALASVRFAASSESTGEITHGKTSIGKQARAELTGASRVPEYVSLTLPIFQTGIGFQENVLIECYIEVDAQDEKFKITPLPGEIDGAMLVAENNLIAHIESLVESVDPKPVVYRGTP